MRIQNPHNPHWRPAAASRRPTVKVQRKPAAAGRGRSFLRRILLYGGISGGVLGVLLFAVAGYFALSWQRQLPDYSHLSEYEPPMQTRIHAEDNTLLAEYGRERRNLIPYEDMPERIKHAFLAAEDKNFFRHGGIDLIGIMRATVQNAANLMEGRRLVGASTITQQVAKNFLLSREVSLERKGKEILLALSMERSLSKERILELYLNEIYLGFGSYGVASAAENYFGKSLDDLSIAEAAYLAALAKGPSNYHPVRARARAVERRDWVITRMAEDRRITSAEAAIAKTEDLQARPQPDWGAQVFGAEYFVEEIRRQLYRQYGEDTLYEGGLSVRATLSPRLQRIAQQALRNGLLEYDRRHGWRGALRNVADGENWRDNWRTAVADMLLPQDLAPWQLAVVVNVTDDAAAISLLDAAYADSHTHASENTENMPRTGVIPFSELAWAAPWRSGQRIGAKPKKTGDVLHPGDVIYVEALAAKDDEEEGVDAGGNEDGNAGGEARENAVRYALRQLPDVNGALVAMDPFSGRVLAMQGGFSYSASEFNRAQQARRQPGSAFKPFVYAIALERGYTPASIILDAPLVIDQGAGLEIWKPENYSQKFYGPSPLRVGVEKSRNVMTVRLAYALGMEEIAAELRKFDLVDQFPPLLSMALGAGETSLMRMVSGYATFVNGGRKIEPTLTDDIFDRYGNAIHPRNSRPCTEAAGCVQEARQEAQWEAQEEETPSAEPAQDSLPPLPTGTADNTALLTPQTAYQVVSMLEGVVQRGTGRSLRSLPHSVAGKTGTTNEERDAWFIGFSPDMVVGVYIGFDEPRPLGYRETGGRVAAPVFREFMSLALEGQRPTPFPVPTGIRFMHIDAKTGVLARPGAEGSLLEAFKLGGPGPNTAGAHYTALQVLDIDAGQAPPQSLFRAPGGFRSFVDDDADSLPNTAENIAPPSARPRGFDDGLY